MIYVYRLSHESTVPTSYVPCDVCSLQKTLKFNFPILRLQPMDEWMNKRTFYTAESSLWASNMYRHVSQWRMIQTFNVRCLMVAYVCVCVRVYTRLGALVWVSVAMNYSLWHNVTQWENIFHTSIVPHCAVVFCVWLSESVVVGWISKPLGYHVVVVVIIIIVIVYRMASGTQYLKWRT